MHVHGSQLNPNAAVDAMQAAQKAVAAREAAQTRRKLLESAAELEADSFVAQIEDQDESARQPKRPPNPKEERKARHVGRGDADQVGEHLSNWA